MLNISGVQQVKKQQQQKTTLLLLLSGCVEVFHQCSFFVNTLAPLRHMLALPFISVTRASAEHSLTFMSSSVQLISEQNLLQA